MMLHKDTIIEVDKYKTEGSCDMCRKFVVWIECESPVGHSLCSNCGWRKSKKEYKLIINKYGYYFEDGGTNITKR